MTPNHAISEGARYERAATRARLRRMIKQYEGKYRWPAAMALQTELAWQLARQKRYDAKPGGLGRK